MRPLLQRAVLSVLLSAALAGGFAAPGAECAAHPPFPGLPPASEAPADNPLALGRLLPPLPDRAAARIIQVPDGDTVRLADRRTVRLACVDAPDMPLSSRDRVPGMDPRRENFEAEPDPLPVQPRAAKKKPWYYSAEAQSALRQLALNQPVSLRAPQGQRAQGRLVADAELADGTSLSAWLVSQGLAYVVLVPGFPEEYMQALKSLQVRALRERRGFWPGLLSQVAARRPWIGNSETRLFYAGGDVRSQQIKPRLRVYFGTLMDAFLEGFAPASPLDFWPEAQ